MQVHWVPAHKDIEENKKANVASHDGNRLEKKKKKEERGIDRGGH